jgi:hypothetical protein
VVALAACGGSSPHHDIDASVDTAVDAPAGVTWPAGRVALLQNNVNGGIPSTDVELSSIAYLGAPKGSVGPCTVFDYTMRPHLSAGTITITSPNGNYTLAPSGTAPTVTYPAPPVNNPAFSAGDTITFSAAGGPDLGAFSGTVTAPPTLAGFTPPASISRSGFTATWTAASSDQILVVMAALTGGTITDALACIVPDTGSFEVSAATFALVSSSDTTSTVSVARIATMTTTASGKSIMLAASSFIGSNGTVPLNP